MPLDVGLVGAGNIADAHLPAYRDHEESTLAGVCDADEDRARETAEAFGVDYWTDYEAFVVEAPIDAVDVCLPHDLHYPVARAALEADKHVLVEKPFAVSMAECVDLVDLADARDLILMVGQMQRFDPANRALARRVRSGDLGPIHGARVDGIQNLHDYADAGHWLFDGSRAGGGGVISVLVHKLDLLRYLAGDVERAIALGKTAHPDFEGAEDYCVGLLELEDGTLVDCFSTYSAAGIPYGEMIWLFGEDAVAHTLPVEGDYSGLPRIGTGREFAPVEPAGDLPTDDPFVNEILHFADCVRSGDEPLSSGRDNLGTMATIFAIYESLADDGAPVRPADLIERARGE